MLDINETAILMTKYIEEGKPFMVGRYGNSEMLMMEAYIKYRCNLRHRYHMVNLLHNSGGFFPNNLFLQKRFCEEMKKATEQVDIQATWDMAFEDELLKAWGNDPKRTKLGYITPWERYKYTEMTELPWSAALKGKKVLVVHPFAKSIMKQYSNNREKIFAKLLPADQILPEFDLKVFKSVQTIAGNKDPRFKDWFEALDWMSDEISKIDFDVAVLGCGAYGYPLAARIKKMGKGAIHLGGATQCMFGIIGQRWKNFPGFMDIVYNDSWVTPSEEERPDNISIVEGACYW